MIIIDADCIIANMLLTREHITICDLNKVKKKIMHKFPNIYVDITKNSIIPFVNMYNLSWEDDVIKHKEGKYWTKEYVDDCFSWNIPEDIRDDFLKILRSCN